MGLLLRNLFKTYRSVLRGRVEALRGVDLEVRKGEFFVILGPSGCGKSTLLNLVAGLEEPTEGEIHLGGRLVARRGFSLPPKSRNVALVFQSYALYPHMSAFDNIAFPLRISGLSGEEVKERVREVSRMLGIENLLGAKPAELSGGERQRVAIARALVRRPEILLLDEPLSNLDAQLRQRMRVELKKLQRQLGLTTLYVTHDQTEAMTLADRLSVMKEGRIVQVGEPIEVYRNPADPFVASFLGSPPMNVLRRRVRKEGGRRWVDLFGERLSVETDRDYIYVGVRPEDISIVGEGLFPVELVERLGDETLLHVRVDAERVVVKIHGDKDISEGCRVSLRAHRFRVFEA